MPDSPDFDRMADVCLARVYEVRSKGLIAEHSVVVAQLRQSGTPAAAADIALLAADGTSRPGIDGMLRTLDR